MVYYNEIDPFAVAWLRELITAGVLPDGEIDTRSILDVRPTDLAGYTQHHFFAGIGGWPYALGLAGWPDDRPIWTGSCPCQPFSASGRRGAFADERHLWPAWYWLVAQCRPQCITGEQVSTPAGRAWLDLVSTDLEACGYTIGAIGLPAASIGAPHARHRLFFVGLADRARLERYAGDGDERPQSGWLDPAAPRSIGAACAPRALADDDARGLPAQRAPRLHEDRQRWHDAARCGAPHFWHRADWIACRDNVLRPVEPGTRPVADGVPRRVGRLRGYGNAIVPDLAAAFVRTWMDGAA